MPTAAGVIVPVAVLSAMMLSGCSSPAEPDMAAQFRESWDLRFSQVNDSTVARTIDGVNCVALHLPPGATLRSGSARLEWSPQSPLAAELRLAVMVPSAGYALESAVHGTPLVLPWHELPSAKGGWNVLVLVEAPLKGAVVVDQEVRLSIEFVHEPGMEVGWRLQRCDPW